MGTPRAHLHVADAAGVIASLLRRRPVLYGSLVRLVVIAILILVLGGCSDAPPSPASAPRSSDGTAGAGTITGRVTFEGALPPDEIIRLDADPQCVAQAQGEVSREGAVLIGDDRSVQNVFVYVAQGLPPGDYPPPESAVVLDQQKCRYVPRVLGVQVGQALTIRNSDTLLHTVRADAATNPRFNVATPLKGFEVTRTFPAAEVMVPIECDMHPWMHAYVGVLEHPFFSVTDQAGNFSVKGLPAGTFTLVAWHERLGTVTREITVQPGEAARADFVFAVVQ